MVITIFFVGGLLSDSYGIRVHPVSVSRDYDNCDHGYGYGYRSYGDFPRGSSKWVLDGHTSRRLSKILFTENKNIK